MNNLSGNKNGIEWSVTIKPTPNAKFHAIVTVGRWSAISEDFLTKEEAKDNGCAMVADMVKELEDLIHA
jgi:hypothetical protein